MNLPSSAATSSNHNIMISACHDAKKKPSKNKRGGGGVELSTDPQGVAARHRRRRISDRFKILRSLVPGGAKMDTVSMLEEAIQYVKFLKDQIWLHQAVIGSFADCNSQSHHSSNMNSSNDYSSNGARHPTLNFQQNVVNVHREQIPLDNHQQVVHFSGDYLVNDYHVQYCESSVGCQGSWFHGEGVGPF